MTRSRTYGRKHSGKQKFTDLLSITKLLIAGSETKKKNVEEPWAHFSTMGAESAFNFVQNSLNDFNAFSFAALSQFYHELKFCTQLYIMQGHVRNEYFQG